MEKRCAAGCGEKVKEGDERHVFRDPVDDTILFYHIECCPLCPRELASSDIPG